MSIDAAPSPGDASGATPRFRLAALLGRRFGFMVCAQWGSGLLTGVLMVLLARSGPEIFGLFTLALALGTLVTMITGAGLDSYLVPLFTEKNADKRRILTQTFCLQLLLLLLSLLLLALLCSLLGHGAEKSVLILLIAAGMGGVIMGQPFFVLCRVQGRQDTEMRLRIPTGLLSSAFGILALSLDAPLPVIACFKLVEALGLFLCIGTALRWRPGKISWNFSKWAGRRQDGLIFAGIAVCGLLYNKLNQYTLDHVAGSYALGLYNAPWEIVDTLCILVSGALIEKVMFPLMAGQWERDRRTFRQMTRVAVACLLLFALCSSYALFVEGDRLLSCLYGAEYLQATPLLRIQLFCIPAAFLHNLAACMLISMRCYKPVLLVYIGGLVVNAILCATLIPTQGAVGAAWAISGAKIWMVVGTMSLAIRGGLELPVSRLAAAALAAALAWGIHFCALPLTARITAELLGFLPLAALIVWWIAPLLTGKRQAPDHEA